MKNLLLVVICLLLCGCATQRTYIQEGASAEDKESIKVLCESEHAHSIMVGADQKLFISSIDGKSTMTVEGLLTDKAPYAEMAYVKPGRHYLNLRYTYGPTFADGRVWFDAEAGKTYIIHRKATGYQIAFWMEELGTGKVVGGIPGGEPPSDKSSSKQPGPF